MKKRISVIFILALSCFSLFSFCGFRFAGVKDGKEEAVKMPILMYHAVVPDSRRADAYTIRIKDLTADLEYIKSEGYTTVLPGEVIAYAEGRADLPEKPIMITFDDGFYGVKKLAAPELEKRGQRAVVAVVGTFSERAEKEDSQNLIYGYLTAKDCAEMQKSGTFEIAAHSYALHSLSPRKGVKRLSGESDEHYSDFFREDTQKLTDMLGKENIRPAAYAYPFGAFDKLSDGILSEMGYKMTFGCNEKVNVLSRGESLFGMKRFNRSGVGKSAKQILKNL